MDDYLSSRRRGFVFGGVLLGLSLLPISVPITACIGYILSTVPTEFETKINNIKKEVYRELNSIPSY